MLRQKRLQQISLPVERAMLYVLDFGEYRYILLLPAYLRANQLQEGRFQRASSSHLYV
jgi:hypothetical protein